MILAEFMTEWTTDDGEKVNFISVEYPLESGEYISDVTGQSASDILAESVPNSVIVRRMCTNANFTLIDNDDRFFTTWSEAV